jgi:diguanylate cyclase (GGDEF)-like protein
MALRGTMRSEGGRGAFWPIVTTLAALSGVAAAAAAGAEAATLATAIGAAAAASVGHIAWRCAQLDQAFRDAAKRATQDPLTGLPHRNAFENLVADALRQAASDGPSVTVVKIDLRRFREINDQFGRAAGDTALLEAKDRLLAASPNTAKLARTGGDEFAAVLLHDDAQAPERLADAWSCSMREPLSLGGSRLTLTPSIGYVTARSANDDLPDVSEMLRRADVALSASKSGVKPIVVHTPQHSADLKARKSLERDLRHALANDGLHVEFQPLWAADGLTMVGAEALARWRHPVRGMVPPLEFVAIAEERGFIDELGEFVLKRACQEARSWPEPLFVAVNVSPVQFRNEAFVDRVSSILEDTGLVSDRLELELTESAIVVDESNAEDAIMELRARGVRMALDDFGTGYSSLIYLRRFAFDKIKIDRSFLDALEPTGESAILVESIVHLGRSLGLTVTGEGVETLEQHRFLEAIGCHELQGYLFAKAMSSEALARLCLEKRAALTAQRNVA